jgi:tetratricopeptide (TPR) repeat protein
MEEVCTRCGSNRFDYRSDDLGDYQECQYCETKFYQKTHDLTTSPLNRARKLMRDGDFRHAQTLLEQALLAAPDNPRVHLGLLQWTCELHDEQDLLTYNRTIEQEDYYLRALRHARENEQRNPELSGLISNSGLMTRANEERSRQRALQEATANHQARVVAATTELHNLTAKQRELESELKRREHTRTRQQRKLEKLRTGGFMLTTLVRLVAVFIVSFIVVSQIVLRLGISSFVPFIVLVIVFWLLNSLGKSVEEKVNEANKRNLTEALRAQNQRCQDLDHQLHMVNNSHFQAQSFIDTHFEPRLKYNKALNQFEVGV